MSFLPPSAAVSSSPLSPRRRRQRPYRLSTDTTASISSLPAYSAPLRPTHSNWPADDTPTDQPPDYPQSAEEADTEDIDSKYSVPRLRVPRSQQQHPRRIRQHRRGLSSLSLLHPPSVDDLLERSVVALELSTNALLQSISSTSALSAITSDEHERTPSRFKMLDKQPSPPKDSFLNHHHHSRHRQPWMDDFNDVLRRVDGLLLPPENDDAHSVSRSLPAETSIVPPKGKNGRLYLNLTTSSELDLTRSHSARAPRALTQYVSVESTFGTTADATANGDSIFLPSTLGLRAPSQVRHFSPSPPRVSSGQPTVHKSRSVDSSSSALHLPPSVSVRPSSVSPSRPSTRRYSAGSADTSVTITSGFRGIPLSTSTTRSSSSRTSTSFSEMPPPAPLPPPVRAMTPPTEESTPISSSEDDRPLRALQSLRKILDDTPLGKDRYSISPPPPSHPSKLKFMPRTPAVVPSSGTSMATASVYRLFTRNSHHASSSSSHPKSSMKKFSPVVSTQPGSPSPGDSRQSSRPSTPRQVTFAELPAEFPGRPRNNRIKNKHKTGKAKSDEKEESRWLSWFTPSLGIGTSSANIASGGMAYEERMEDKMMRGWGRSAASTPGGVPGAEDWLV